MSLGKGAFCSSSKRQKLNTKSSAEVELVGIDDMMGQVLWTRYFLEAQGCDIKENIVHQDNMSLILLEKNDRGSSGKRMRHINVRHFFVTGRIAAGEMTVKHCPTKEMISDTNAKPLQGALFRQFRDAILDVPACDGPASPPSTAEIHRSVLGVKGKDGSDQGQTWAQVVKTSRKWTKVIKF